MTACPVLPSDLASFTGKDSAEAASEYIAAKLAREGDLARRLRREKIKLCWVDTGCLRPTWAGAEVCGDRVREHVCRAPLGCLWAFEQEVNVSESSRVYPCFIGRSCGGSVVWSCAGWTRGACVQPGLGRRCVDSPARA